MHIIIDGYNLIFTVPALEKVLDRENMEMAREALLMVLARYKDTSRQEFTVVFDGSKHEGGNIGPSQRQVRGGISIIFSKGATADEDIVGLISSSPNPRDICIVTSDKTIIKAARESGCRTIRPREFYRKVTVSARVERVLPRAEPMAKYQGLPEGEVEYWMKVFKVKSETDEKSQKC